MVQAIGVEKSFGDNHVLRGIDLEVETGEVLCLIGPSGSGKSTFLRCINRLETIDGGVIAMNGGLIGVRERNGRLYDLNEAQIAEQRRAVGMVFQRFNLFPHMTALENIIEAPIHVRKESKATVMERAMTLLDRVGLRSHKDHYPSQLSGGQQQRIAIARALAMEPQLMLFDEPTSALDPELVGEVLDTMRELAASGMTMIVVTHEMEFAREVADSVVFMADGRVVEAGNPKQVLTTPTQDRTRRFISAVRGAN